MVATAPFVVQPQRLSLLRDPIGLRRLALVADPILVMGNPLDAPADYRVDGDLEFLLKQGSIAIIDAAAAAPAVERWLGLLADSSDLALAATFLASQRVAPAEFSGGVRRGRGFALASFDAQWKEEPWHPAFDFLPAPLAASVDEVVMRQILPRLPMGNPLSMHAFRLGRWFAAGAAAGDMVRRRDAKLYASAATARALGEVVEPLSKVDEGSRLGLAKSVADTHQFLLEAVGVAEVLAELPIEKVCELRDAYAEERHLYLAELERLVWADDPEAVERLVVQFLRPAILRIDREASSRLGRLVPRRLRRLIRRNRGKQRDAASAAVAMMRFGLTQDPASAMAALPAMTGLVSPGEADWPRIFHAVRSAV